MEGGRKEVREEGRKEGREGGESTRIHQLSTNYLPL